MNIVKKNSLNLIVVSVCLFFVNCKNKNLSTGIAEIDNEYKFKDTYAFKEDSLYFIKKVFFNKTLEDSIFIIGTKKQKEYTVRIHGWGINEKRIGDWYYEKVFNDGTISIDSIENYVILCDKNPINTIKRFKNNKLDRTKGYFYDVDMPKDIFVEDTLNIKFNFVYDTVTYKHVGNELYFFKPPNINDRCNASTYVIDSFPIRKNSARMQFLVGEKGKNLFLGYYYLVPKKQKEKGMTTVTQVFTQINFEVK